MKFVQLLHVSSPISSSVVETGRGENITSPRDDPITARNGASSTHKKNQVGRNKSTTKLTPPIYGQTLPPTLPNSSNETISRLNELKQKPTMSMSISIKNNFKKSYLKRNVKKSYTKRNLKKSNSKRTTSLTITEDYPERTSE